MRLPYPERIHPTLWRASQLAPGGLRRLPSGYSSLDEALGGGWPLGALIELLPEHAGIGEVHLLCPALAGLADRRRPTLLLNPPYAPSMQCWAAWGLRPDDVVWVRTSSPRDATWAATQILHYQSCAALLCWAHATAYADLLQWHRLARRGSTLVVLYRPHDTAHQDSPAELRVALRAIPGGLRASFLKYPGPIPSARDLTLYPHDHDLDQPGPAAPPGRLPGVAGTPVPLYAAPDDAGTATHGTGSHR